jgi:hypothetical protein
MAGNGIIGALLVSAGMDTADLEDGAKRAATVVGGLQGKLGTAMAAAGAAVAAGVATAGVALVGFGAKALTAADDIGDAAQRLGITSEAFQKLDIAATQAGAAPGLMMQAMDKLNVGLGAFIQNGGGPAAEAFEQLGLASRIASGEIDTADEAFYAATAALENIQDPALKARMSMQLFGRAAGADMIEVLAPGAEALKGYGEAAQEAGRVMSDEMVAKLADAKLAIDNTKTAASQIATVFAGEFIVASAGVLDKLQPMIDQGKELAKQIGDFLGPSFQELGSAIGALMSGPFGQTLMTVMRGVATVAGGALVLALRAAADGVTILVRGIDGLSRIIAGVGPAMERAGRQIVEGLVRGFSDASRIALQAVRTLGENVMAAFRAVLGIQSPSRVFAEYGENIAQGVAVGINSGSPEAQAAIRSLASDLDSLMGSLLTDRERGFIALNDNIATLTDGLGRGLITLQQYDEALKRIIERDAPRAFGQIAESVGQFRMSGGNMDALAGMRAAPGAVATTQAAVNDNAQDWADAFTKGLEAAFEGDFKGFAKRWALDWLSGAFRGALGNLGNAMGGSSGGGIFASLGNIFKGFKLPGFKTGGSFRVGGSGGADSQTVAFRATPGEMVDIRRPGQGAGNVVNVYADGYITEQVLRGMIADAMVQTGTAAQVSTISTIQRRAGRAFAA